jgi:predicted NAD/FAD-binding protein
MRIAVVGSGIAGLYAAWRLAALHDVTVFEADDYAGGHTHTVDVQYGGRSLAIDTGFIVFNDWTYPNFIAMLQELGVAWQPSNMSFSLRCESSGLEYNGTSLNSLFAQRRNLLRPSFLRMIADILRFNTRAKAWLRDTAAADVTLGEFVAAGGYSRQFVDHYIVPMGRAIWSAEASAMLGFPARFFIGFFDRHGFLNVDDRPVWQTVKGGSREYVRALLAATRARLRLARRSSRSAACPRMSSCARHPARSNRSTTCSSPAIRTRRSACSRHRPPPSRKRSAPCHTRPTRRSCTPTSGCCRGADWRGRHGTTTCCATRRSLWHSPTT